MKHDIFCVKYILLFLSICMYICMFLNKKKIHNYHDGWLIGDHMIMIMDRDYDLCRLIHVDCYWLIMMINMADDLLMAIYHEWWMIIMIIDDLSLLIMTGHGWWLIARLSDWLIDWLIDDKIMITRSVMMPKASGLYRPTGLLLV